MADSRELFGVGDVVRKLRKDNHLTIEELATKAGVDKMTLMHFENENRDPRGSTINKVAKALGFPNAGGLYALVPKLRDLPRQTGTGEPTIDAVPDDVDVRRGYEPQAIPVIAEGEATPRGLIWTTTIVRHAVIEYVARPHDIEDPDAYGLLVIGDSMQPTFRKGHRLIVSPRTPVDDGDEVYVQLVSGERLIKLAFRTDTGWRLESVNPKYGPREVRAEEIEAMHAIVWAKRKLPGRRVIDETTGKRR